MDILCDFEVFVLFLVVEPPGASLVLFLNFFLFVDWVNFLSPLSELLFNFAPTTNDLLVLLPVDSHSVSILLIELVICSRDAGSLLCNCS